jgi:hypothetical protein
MSAIESGRCAVAIPLVERVGDHFRACLRNTYAVPWRLYNHQFWAARADAVQAQCHADNGDLDAALVLRWQARDAFTAIADAPQARAEDRGDARSWVSRIDRVMERDGTTETSDREAEGGLPGCPQVVSWTLLDGPSGTANDDGGQVNCQYGPQAGIGVPADTRLDLKGRWVAPDNVGPQGSMPSGGCGRQISLPRGYRAVSSRGFWAYVESSVSSVADPASIVPDLQRAIGELMAHLENRAKRCTSS